MSWTSEEIDKGHLHVYPNDDLCSHLLHEGRCQCQPKVKAVGKYTMFVHNSWDEREKEELFDVALRKFAQQVPRRYN